MFGHIWFVGEYVRLSYGPVFAIAALMPAAGVLCFGLLAHKFRRITL
jgi:hypothetical protein